MFRGQYRFRTLNGVLASIVPLLFGAASAAVSLQVLTIGDGLIERLVVGVFVLGAAGCGILGLLALSGWILNRQIVVEINEEGVVRGSCFWPWNEIHSFTGTRYANGVCLGILLHVKIMLRRVELPTTPLLSEQQYIDLALDLERRIAVRFPNLDLAMSPTEPDGE